MIYYNINTRYDERSIMTIFGELNFSRTYYEDKQRQNHFYFIDKILNLPKHSKYDQSSKAIAIKQAMQTNQKKGGELYADCVNPFKNTSSFKISRQTIYNWLVNWKIPKINYSKKEETEVLYVMIDEKYIHEQQHNKEVNNKVESKTDKDIADEITDTNTKKTNKKSNIMSKCFVTFTSISDNPKDKKKRVLNNKFVFITSCKQPWKEFMDQVSKVYDFSKIKTIITLSDAGKWITAGFSELKLYSHIVIINGLCLFHVYQTVNRISRDTEIRTKIREYIDNNDKKGFINYMKEFKTTKDTKRIEKLDKYENYITNHWKWIQNMKESEFKSSMESHISHNTAAYFSSRPKAFSNKRIEQLLKLNEYVSNGIDIADLYLKTYNDSESRTYNEIDINYSHFEKQSKSNLPILENGHLNKLYNCLNSIAHN